MHLCEVTGVDELRGCGGVDPVRLSRAGLPIGLQIRGA
jgi:hypothetical protein